MSTGVYLALSPLLVIALGGVLLMLAEAFSHRREEGEGRSSGPSSDIALGTAITMMAGAVATIAVWSVGPDKLEGAASLAPFLIIDRFTLFFTFVLCLGAALAALLAGGYLPEHRLDRGEVYPLLTFSTIGAITLAAAGDLLTLFLGLETMSLGVYALTAFRRGSPRSTEAAVKYFLLGSFAAALLLYGGALIYGATGHTDLAGIRTAITAAGHAAPALRPGGIAPAGANLGVVLIGVGLIVVGLAFKVSAVPFHMWTPDAYEGAPTPTTTFMAVAVKSAAFATLLRVLIVAFGDPQLTSWAAGWPPVVATLAVLTMTVANLIAGRQESVKRMLAYSSIAHAGYVLVGVVSTLKGGEDGQASVLFYLLAYTVSTAGAFGALILCGSRGSEAVSYEDLAGLGKRHPTVALVFSLFLLSLAGVPPTAGFFGKLYVVKATIGAGLYPLAVLLLLNSALGAYYYLRVLVFMYMREPAPGAAIAKPMRSGYVNMALALAGVLVVVLGIWPTTPLRLAAEAVLAAR
jgi:NADH-quinone oxidoreductase subunit N